MVFNFLKYIKPIWYFNLKSKIDYSYFPTINQLQNNNFQIEIDLNFQTLDSQQRDLAYRALQSGFINIDKEKGLDIYKDSDITIKDEYRFLRKNFNIFWVFYVLILRILTLNNPFKEIFGFVKSKNSLRENYTQNIFHYPQYDSFISQLITQNPLITVIIPTLNRYQYLEKVMVDLENQTYKNFEVIVVDQTDNYQEIFYKNWNLDIKYWHQPEKALWKARNNAILNSHGNYILLYDDDSLVDKDWIMEHLKTLDFFNADISSGVSFSLHGDKIPSNYSYFKWSDQLDTGNVLIKKSVFKSIGLFDLQFEKQRMGDAEFGLRAYLAGFKNISNHKAKRIHLKVSIGGLREMGSWDSWRSKKIFAPKPIPSVLYFTRKYYGNKLSKFYIIQAILSSLVPYHFKGNKILKIISSFFIPLLLPIIFLKIFKSWKLANIKLKEGEKINKF